MAKQFTLYKITNSINKKVYIGITIRPIKTRFQEHIRHSIRKKKYKLHKAMFKYGHENFKIEKICLCKTIEKLSELEILFIKKYNSYKRGYNMTIGGDGVTDWWIGKKHKKSSKKKISKGLLGNTNSKFRVNFVKVDLLNKEGEILHTYNSVKSAADNLGIKCPSDITRYCRGTKKNFLSGHIFQYHSRRYKSKRDV